jgi:ABC-type multidrug transport system fused ATPase/permease subunit
MAFSLSDELRWLFRQARPYISLQVGSLVCITAGSLLYLFDPLVMKWLLDRVLPQRNVRGLLVALVLIFGCYAGRVLFTTLGGLLTFQASQKMVLNLRRRLLSHFDTLSPDYHERQSIGARFYLFKEPMEEIAQTGVDILPSVLRTIVLTLSVLVTMLILNARLTLVLIPLIPIFLFVKQTYRKRLHQSADDSQQEQRSVSSFLQEHLSTITQLQLLSAEKRQERLGFRQFARVVRAQCKLCLTASQFSAASNAITILGMVTVLGMGGEEYFGGRLTIGGLVAFYTYLTRLFEPLSGAVELYSRLQRVGASARKVMGAFELCPSVVEHPRAVVLQKDAPSEIEFSSVWFSYAEGRGVLRDISFRIAPASLVAFVGANGSGKSTTGKLLARLYDPQSGVVRIDGLDIREIRLKSLRGLVCYLPQHAVLFDTDLRTNLRLGNPTTTEAELSWAIELAELEKVVGRLPGGLRCSLGSNGNQLSGGERQRVAIARAVLQKPRILILDEATSFLESRAESAILSRLRTSLPSTTCVVISHHLSALSWTDEIFVLSRGTIIEHGSHEYLSAREGLYTQLFRRFEKNNHTPVARPSE